MPIELLVSSHEACPKLSDLNLERRCQAKGGSESHVRHGATCPHSHSTHHTAGDSPTLGVVQLLMVGKLGAGDAMDSQCPVASPFISRGTDHTKSTITVGADRTRPFQHDLG